MIRTSLGLAFIAVACSAPTVDSRRESRFDADLKKEVPLPVVIGDEQRNEDKKSFVIGGGQAEDRNIERQPGIIDAQNITGSYLAQDVIYIGEAIQVEPIEPGKEAWIALEVENKPLNRSLIYYKSSGEERAVGLYPPKTLESIRQGDRLTIAVSEPVTYQWASVINDEAVHEEVSLPLAKIAEPKDAAPAKLEFATFPSIRSMFGVRVEVSDVAVQSCPQKFEDPSHASTKNILKLDALALKERSTPVAEDINLALSEFSDSSTVFAWLCVYNRRGKLVEGINAVAVPQKSAFQEAAEGKFAEGLEGVVSAPATIARALFTTHSQTGLNYLSTDLAKSSVMSFARIGAECAAGSVVAGTDDGLSPKILCAPLPTGAALAEDGDTVRSGGCEPGEVITGIYGPSEIRCHKINTVALTLSRPRSLFLEKGTVIAEKFAFGDYCACPAGAVLTSWKRFDNDVCSDSDAGSCSWILDASAESVFSTKSRTLSE